MCLCWTGWTTFIYTLSGTIHAGELCLLNVLLKSPTVLSALSDIVHFPYCRLMYPLQIISDFVFSHTVLIILVGYVSLGFITPPCSCCHICFTTMCVISVQLQLPIYVQHNEPRVPL